jgi:hypothetical protein
MLDTKQQARSRVQTDPAAHDECLEFIRVALASNDREVAQDVAAILKEVCQNGHADRAAIWADLTPIEQQQFQELLGPPPLAREAGPENSRGSRLPIPGSGWCNSD